MKKRIFALALAGMLAIGTSVNVFAEDVTQVGQGTEVNSAQASITNNFEMAEGLAVPNVTFAFTITSDTADAPNATIQDISYSNKDEKGNAEGGKYVLSKTSVIDFEAFPHAGEYVYRVQETQGSVEGVTYSADAYTLRVQVANKKDGGLYVKSLTAQKDGVQDKVGQIVFTNTYRKNGSLVITKTTTGELADLTKKFSFTITFTKSATEEAIGKIEGTLTRKGGNQETITCNAGEGTFTLGHGDKIEFTNLPAGTTYNVTEEGAKDGYTPTVQVIANNMELEAKNGTEEGALSSENQYIGEGNNTVDFTNAYHNIPITGILMNNLPFFVLIGAIIVAFVILAVVKRRRTSRRTCGTLRK